MTPFALAAGGTVFVNRGFVPQDRRQLRRGARSRRARRPSPVLLGRPRRSAASPPAPTRPTVSSGCATSPRLAALAGPSPQPVAPVYIDLPAGRRAPAAGRRDDGRVSQQPSRLRHHLVRLRPDHRRPAGFWVRRQRAGRTRATANLAVQPQPRLHQGRARAFHKGAPLMQFVSTRGGAPVPGFSDACSPASPATAASTCPRPGRSSRRPRSRRFADRPYAEVAFDIIRRFVGGEFADDDARSA